MSDLQEVLERATINFPRNVDEREVYRILEFISGDLSYEINGGSFKGFFSIEDGELKEKYESDIQGTISSKDFSRSAIFSFSREIIEDRSEFSGIRFFTTPGYNLEEHTEREVQAWKDIRKSVEDYFKAIKETESFD